MNISDSGFYGGSVHNFDAFEIRSISLHFIVAQEIQSDQHLYIFILLSIKYMIHICYMYNTQLCRARRLYNITKEMPMIISYLIFIFNKYHETGQLMVLKHGCSVQHTLKINIKKDLLCICTMKSLICPLISIFQFLLFSL